MKNNKSVGIKKGIMVLRSYFAHKIHWPERSTRDGVLENIDTFFVCKLLTISVIAFFGMLGIACASSEADITSIFKFTNYVIVIASLFYVGFEILYIAPKIRSKLQELTPLAQYRILKIGRKPLVGLLLAAVFLTFNFVLLQLMNLTGLDLGNQIVDKVTNSFSILGLSTIVISIPTALIFSLPLEEERKISLNLIESFEEVAKKSETDAASVVWLHLIKNVYYRTETFVKQHLTISNVKLTKPFNQISLVAILGNNEQRRKAKEWVKQLGNILENKGLDDPEKVVLIFDHMQQLEQTKEFLTLLEEYEKYGIEYEFTNNRKISSQKYVKLERRLVFIIGIATFVLKLAEFFIFGA